MSGFTDANGNNIDVFVWDLSMDAVTLMSHASSSLTTTGNGNSLPPLISEDGSTAAFQSGATDLVPGGLTSAVYSFDTASAAVSLRSPAAITSLMGNRQSADPAISADGGTMVFRSAATDLVSGTDTNNAADIFAWDRGSGAIALASHSSMSATTTANNRSDGFPVVSADGNTVTFQSYATDLIDSFVDANAGHSDVFIWETGTGEVTLVSHSGASTTTTANSSSRNPVMSADGNSVVFQSSATDLVSGIDANGSSLDVFIWEKGAGAVTLVSHSGSSTTTTANSSSTDALVNADGSSVAFKSVATDLVSGFINANGSSSDVFIWDKGTGAVTLVSHSTISAARSGNGASEIRVFDPELSGDGSLTFHSRATDLVNGTDANNNWDVFVWDPGANAVTLVSHSSSNTTTTGNGTSEFPVISADGSTIAFRSHATDLVSGLVDENRLLDVFIFSSDPVMADLQLTKGDNPDPVGPSGSLLYMLEVENLSPRPAVGISILDSLPPEVTFVGASGTGWSCQDVAGRVGCHLQSLPGLSISDPLTVEVTVPGATGSFTNRATVSWAGPDPDLANNSATETTSVETDDWGDAPDPTYPTLAASNGAHHVVGSGLFLGSQVDPESDGQPNTTATGGNADGNDDEQGVSFTSLLVAGLSASLEVTSSAAGVLDGWVDFNGDGDWLDAGEKVFFGQALTTGVNSLSFTVPGTVTPGSTTYARFRLTSAGIADPTGAAADGEVEDYQLLIDRPSIVLSETASPTTVAEPGGLVGFIVGVLNDGTTSVTLTSLSDDVHGDLNGLGSCSVPQSMGVSASYTCSFNATVAGNPGDSVTNTVTASGTGAGAPVSGSDSATIEVTGLAPSITVNKTASPTTVTEPGGSVTFSVLVNNTSVSSDPVTLLTLVDDVHGNLNGQGDCATGGVIAPGASYSCAFIATVSGVAGDTVTDTVTASVQDDESVGTTGSDSATVSILDGTPPQVQNIMHYPDSGDSVLLECKSVRQAVSTFEIEFDEAMFDPIRHTEPDDVTNPTNFLLVEAGGDRSLQTDACGGPQGDDTTFSINVVTYDDVSHTATLQVGSLSDGLYRIIACGSTTLVDVAGNALDGDGNGTAGDDFLRTFRVDSKNLFENGHFDCNLDSWTRVSTNPAEIFHTIEDADGSSNSGSAGITNLMATTDFEISQCIDIQPGITYGLGLEYRLGMGFGSELELSMVCEIFDGSSCNGGLLVTHVDTSQISDSGGSWITTVSEFSVPSGSATALCSAALVTLSGESFDAYLDQFYVYKQGVFSDGFESGSVSVWSGTSP